MRALTRSHWAFVCCFGLACGGGDRSGDDDTGTGTGDEGTGGTGDAGTDDGLPTGDGGDGSGSGGDGGGGPSDDGATGGSGTGGDGGSGSGTDDGGDGGLDGYGPCPCAQPDEVCLTDMEGMVQGDFCAAPCRQDSDCAEPSAGEAPARCVDAWPGMTARCVLDCQGMYNDTLECPPGMSCGGLQGVSFMCVWEG